MYFQFCYRCANCTKTFKTSKSLQRHVREECGKNPFACPWCPNLFNLKCSLIRHMRLKHDQDLRTRRNDKYRVKIQRRR
ncbi:Similar to gl: Protein glass (Drosophila melanogaster) [Cotesia congregata]|uniref:Similar to gl: Protein glass (Drosophila melanogaster) n=1 Tax=Cotesia congregata TaxID=51543 RepID=A0A8J2MNE6_COTCN|nr:Similar to gl: Protein glass (Drosophila melanogaster) [Cotesia congregata]